MMLIHLRSAILRGFGDSTAKAKSSVIEMLGMRFLLMEKTKSLGLWPSCQKCASC